MMTVGVEIGEPVFISLKSMDLETVQVEDIAVDVGRLAFAVPCPAAGELFVGRDIKALAEVGVGPSALEVRCFDDVKARMEDLDGIVHDYRISSFSYDRLR